MLVALRKSLKVLVSITEDDISYARNIFWLAMYHWVDVVNIQYVSIANITVIYQCYIYCFCYAVLQGYSYMVR